MQPNHRQNLSENYRKNQFQIGFYCLSLFLLLLPSISHAGFHLMSIREVFSGTSDTPNAQYVVLQMYSGGQNRVSGHGVQVYDASGNETHDFQFTSNVDLGANQDQLLIATQEAEELFGITADLTMLPVLPLDGGMVCFDNIDCVSWGNYSGSASAPSASGNPFNPADGLVRNKALRRSAQANNPLLLELGDDSGDSAADFFFAAQPLPANNARQTAMLPQLAVLQTSVNAGGSPDKSVLFLNNTTGEVTATIRDGATDALLTSLNFGSELLPQFFSRAPDINANGHDELVMLGRNPTTGAIDAQVRDSSTGALLTTASYATDFLPWLFTIVPDFNGSGGAELTVLGVRPSDGRVRAELRDSVSGASVGTVTFSSQFLPYAIASTDDTSGNSIPELALLGLRSNGLARVQVKDASTNGQLNNISYGRTFRPRGMAILDDFSGNSEQEIAVLTEKEDTVSVRADIRDILTGNRVSLTRFTAGLEPGLFGSISDTDSNSVPQLFVVQRIAGSARIEVRDASTNSREFIGLNNNFAVLAALPSLDTAAGAETEIDVLSVRDGNTFRCWMYDAVTQGLVNHISFP